MLVQSFVISHWAMTGSWQISMLHSSFAVDPEHCGMTCSQPPLFCSAIPPYCYSTSSGFLQLPASDWKHWCLSTKPNLNQHHPTLKHLSHLTQYYSFSDPPALLDSSHLSRYIRTFHCSSTYCRWWNQLSLDVWIAKPMVVFILQLKTYSWI